MNLVRNVLSSRVVLRIDFLKIIAGKKNAKYIVYIDDITVFT